MHLTTLTLRRFRNFEQVTFSPHEGRNLILGDNGQGKSNLLEALYCLGTGRSHRTAVESELIGWGYDFAVVAGRFRQGNRELSLEVRWILQDDGSCHKAWSWDGNACRRAADFVGRAPMVYFGPEDLEMVTGPPVVRRRLLDLLLVQMDPAGLELRARYREALAQRNRWLQKNRGLDDPNQRAVWDRQLTESGSRLWVNRLDLVRRLAPLVGEAYAALDKGRSLSIGLVTSPALDERSTQAQVMEILQHSLASHRRREELRGQTLTGPHRDDLALLLDGRPLRSFGSRGQQRLGALALRLGQGKLLAQHHQTRPVWLMDDLFSELDPRHRNSIWNWPEPGSQLFITSSEPLDALPGRPDAIFRVEAGNLTSGRGD